MIEYIKGPYSLNLLFQLHGSVLYACFLPGMLSVILFTVLRWHYFGIVFDVLEAHSKNKDLPVVIELLVVNICFVIIYRANFCYNRYYDSCQNIHLMMQQWMDATVHASCFHMQCSHYNKIKPKSLMHHPDLLNPYSFMDRMVDDCNNIVMNSPYRMPMTAPPLPLRNPSISRIVSDVVDCYGRLDGGWGMLYPNDDDDNLEVRKYSCPLYSQINLNTNVINQRDSSWARKITPSPFLQELAHLSSLCVAVAFSTLRDGSNHNCISALNSYPTNFDDRKWPDPDLYKENNSHCNSVLQNILYFLFRSCSPVNRSKYLTNRTLYVIGGISDNERKALCRARGASAKTTLAWYWLSEFLTREHIAGSLGQVDPPIVSRIHQFLSGGMTFYNNARNVMYIPIPFPYEQLSTAIVLPLFILIPLLYSHWARVYWLGALLSFLTTTCLFGISEVARELESPFLNVPNEIPLCTLLAMYNESLISMCFGYHPDHYWRNVG